MVGNPYIYIWRANRYDIGVNLVGPYHSDFLPGHVDRHSEGVLDLSHSVSMDLPPSS